MQDSSVNYEVKAAGTAAASCTCPNAQLHYICKHMMKLVVSVTTQYSGAQIRSMGDQYLTIKRLLVPFYSSSSD